MDEILDYFDSIDTLTYIDIKIVSSIVLNYLGIEHTSSVLQYRDPLYGKENALHFL